MDLDSTTAHNSHGCQANEKSEAVLTFSLKFFHCLFSTPLIMMLHHSYIM